MLYGTKTWCLRENEVAISRRTERPMMRVMCSVKLVDKRNTVGLMDMLGLKKAANKLAWAALLIRTILFLVNHDTLDPDQILHGL